MIEANVLTYVFLKSVISVLGRNNQSQSVDTLQLQIIDAEGVAQTRNRQPPPRKKGNHRFRNAIADDEEDELDEGRTSLQARLMLVLNCKHGKSRWKRSCIGSS